MKKELEDAIKAILTECSEHKTCDGCEFHIVEDDFCKVEDDFCKLDKWPFRWEFEQIK